VNQYSLFSLLSQPDRALDEWLRAHPELFRRVVVPADLKWEVRDKLDEANVTERVLIPGLDGLSSWLARFYLPRAAARRAIRETAMADPAGQASTVGHERKRSTARS
jgi:hypothetical protein